MKKLKKFQKEAVQYLYARKKALLIMGCRTGKTYTALTACRLSNSLNIHVLPVYCIAPVSVRHVWENEYKEENLDFLFITYLLIGKKTHFIPKESILIIDEVQLYMHDWKNIKL